MHSSRTLVADSTITGKLTRGLFCHDAEAWGPVSQDYYDFTPCFVKVPLFGVSAFAIVAGAFSIWCLLSKCAKLPTQKDWNYYTKLVIVAAIAFITTLEGSLQVKDYPSSLSDFRFWTTVIQIAAFGIIFSIHELEHERSRVPSSVVLLYWLFYLLAAAINVRSLYIRNFTRHEALFAMVVTNWVLGLAVFLLELFVPKKQSLYRPIGDEKESPGEYAHIFSAMSFSWMTPLMRHGYKNFIKEDDLWDLPSRAVAKFVGGQIWKSWKSQAGDPGVWKALFKTYGAGYALWMPVKMFSDILGYCQPQLLKLLILFVSSYSTDQPDPPLRGFLIAVTMFGVSLGQSIGNNNFMNFIFEMSQCVRAGLIALIYKKSLKLSNEGRASKSTGDIVNLMAVDTQRISEISRQGHQLWSAPWQILLCMMQLYGLLGWPGLAGVIVMALMIPLNAALARMMKKYQKRNLANKDERTALTTEILNNIKSIKLYSWTQAFAEKLAYIRNEKEMRTLRKIGATQAASRFCWMTTPFLVSCGTFSLFSYFGSVPLTIDLVFPALTLFNLLTQPLTQLPNAITAAIESVVAAGRLKSFLLADEVQKAAVTRLPAATERGAETVVLRNGNFTWGNQNDVACLSNVNFIARKGELSCIVGQVGSGKSSLLQAILGDLRKLDGDVIVHGSIAYVAQNAWIMNASVRQNVLFGNAYHQEWYEKTIHACALIDDLAILPDGDRTEVGEKGIALSGGQKARLQLARAVYARADVYLLDDVLSAVDAHVGRHIITNVLGPKGLLRSKTRVLATNSIPVLKEARHISLISDGRIKEQFTYWEAISHDGEIAALIRTVKSQSHHDTGSPGTSVSNSPVKTTSGIDSDDEDDEDLIPGFTRKESFNNEKESPEEVLDFGVDRKIGDLEMGIEPKKVITRQLKEKSESGKVKWSIYWAYAHACDLHGVFLWLFCVLSVQALQVGSSLWLKTWAESNEQAGSNTSLGKNIGIYFALGMASSLMVALQTMVMWIYCSIRASKNLHERMARAMFRSPMSFFETTPMGRVLNRFSSDMWRVDEALNRSFSELFTNGAKAGCTLIVISCTNPLFIAMLLPLGLLYTYIQRYYLRSNRELKRLESVSRSPIYAHFAETLCGLSTIRAFQQSKKWTNENEFRIDANMKAWLPAIYANRWLGIRLESIGALVVFSTSTLSILNVINGGNLSAGMVGLAMSYALQITQALNWVVRQSVDVETNIISVERVLEYANLPPEAEDVIHSNRPAPTWPSNGAISYSGYSMRYRPGLDLVLKNISLSIKAREKIGVVGRTGAGKSSLTLSLFRIVEPSAGSTEIDNLDISSIGLEDLRCRLSIIPQDAAMFEGTIRDNLDPNHKKSDEQLWEALGHARLKNHVSKMPKGLDAAVLEGGSNLSQGQKQLVSLARALLTDSSILVLDEATAAVDVETDALLQQTLRSDLFADRTVVTIAHRLNTVIDCDRILVLQRGEVLEFGSPAELVAARGQFFSLAREAGLLDANGNL